MIKYKVKYFVHCTSMMILARKGTEESLKTQRMNGLADIHTHILPGVDDGAADMAQARKLLHMAYEDGIRMLFLTPHYRKKYRKNTPADLREVFLQLEQIVRQDFPDMKLCLGSEIHYELDAPEQLAQGNVLTLQDSDYCLLEFRPGALRSQVLMGVSEMIRYGYTPIIAHAERYDVFLQDKTLADEVLDMGALIQLNADSVLGKNGWKVKRFCKRLLKDEQVHFIASDAHDTEQRPPLLQACWQMICKKYGDEYANRLFIAHPQAIIDNEKIM